jgi:hypothetical protein
MHTLVDPSDPDEIPTQRDPPSGKWLISVDRASKRLEDAIGRIEAGPTAWPCLRTSETRTGL